MGNVQNHQILYTYPQVIYPVQDTRPVKEKYPQNGYGMMCSEWEFNPKARVSKVPLECSLCPKKFGCENCLGVHCTFAHKFRTTTALKCLEKYCETCGNLIDKK